MSREGVVLKSTGSWYRVLSEGEELDCRLRGKLRLEGFRATNPVAVGDRVRIAQAVEEWRIEELLPRKNFLLRRSIKLSKRLHFLACNVDQMFLMVSLKEPETSFEFIDRVLAATEAHGIKCILLLNKTDLLTPEEQVAFTAIYEAAGFEVLPMSLVQDPPALQERFKNRVTLLAGHSGVGKSTLVNLIDPKIKAMTGEISEYHETGQHTTTFAEMHPLAFGGFLIDTPGIRGFGVIEIDKKSLSHFFPEMKAVLAHCKFSNCQHSDEPGCAVKDAVELGLIAESRYKSYLNILLEDEDSKYR